LLSKGVIPGCRQEERNPKKKPVKWKLLRIIDVTENKDKG